MFLSPRGELQMSKILEDADIDRRTVLRGVGTVAVTGMLAGCGGGDGGDGGSDGGDGGSDGGDGGSGSVPSEVEDYLSDANNYDGVTDQTGSSSVSVDVGAGDAGLAFGPAAIRISTGTTVTWNWTGQGGSHNVVAEDTTFDSGELKSSGSYEYTFESTGVYTYYCEPHKASGMKGAVIVE